MNDGKKYHTRQQDAILHFMENSPEKYVTVSQIATYLKEDGQSVGLTTIYRHLDKFEKEGIVHKIVLDGNSGACYQFQEQEDNSQMLLKCEECGGITPMDCSHMVELYHHVEEDHQFHINPHRTIFYGVCNRCQK